MAQRIVTAQLNSILGGNFAQAKSTIRLLTTGAVSGVGVYLTVPHSITSDANGAFSVSLWVNEESDNQALYEIVFPDLTSRQFLLPAGSGSIDLATLLAANPPSASNDNSAWQLRAERGQANGYAPLDSQGRIPGVHFPSFFVTGGEGLSQIIGADILSGG